uniref:Endonuclease/exonuclease/phosphatase domain-containing protein n=1 Tax=Sarcophilus harrisii TaxID=9305 RepID=A0A7N4PDN7_SARHA
MTNNTELVILTINENGVNTPIKRKWLADWIKSQNPTIGYLEGDTYRVKIKGCTRTNCASGEVKKAGIAILISDQAKVKIDLIKSDKEWHFILLLKGIIDNKAISILNIYAPSGVACKFLKEKLRELQEEIDSKSIIVGDLNLALSELDQSKPK